MPRPERMRMIAPELTELRLDASEELMKKIQRVRELKGELGLTEIFSRALEAYLEVEDPLRKLKRAEQRARRKAELKRADQQNGALMEEKASSTDAPTRAPESSAAQQSTRAPESAPSPQSTRSPESAAAQQTPAAPKNPRTRYLAVATRAETWARSQGQCEYRDPRTGARCRSRYRLQFEHIQPFAQGGLNEPSNIQNLCVQHNRLRAVQAYGERKMGKFVKI